MNQSTDQENHTSPDNASQDNLSHWDNRTSRRRAASVLGVQGISTKEIANTLEYSPEHCSVIASDDSRQLKALVDDKLNSLLNTDQVKSVFTLQEIERNLVLDWVKACNSGDKESKGKLLDDLLRLYDRKFRLWDSMGVARKGNGRGNGSHTQGSPLQKSAKGGKKVLSRGDVSSYYDDVGGDELSKDLDEQIKVLNARLRELRELKKGLGDG